MGMFKVFHWPGGGGRTKLCGFRTTFKGLHLTTRLLSEPRLTGPGLQLLVRLHLPVQL